MTPCDDVRRAIGFGRPARLPLWDSYWNEFTDAWQKHRRTDADPRDHYPIGIGIAIGDESLFPSTRAVLRSTPAGTVERDGWGRTIRKRPAAKFIETLEHTITVPADIDRVNPEPAALEARFVGFSEAVDAECRAGRWVAAKIGGIYRRTAYVRGEDRLLVDMALDEPFADALFDLLSEHLTRMATETLRRGDLWAQGLFVYDDMADSNSTLFSPAMFERFLLPRYQRLIHTVRKAGCRHVFFHSDGNIRPVLDMLIEAGFEGFHPLEPRCGYDLPAMREHYGSRIVFFGGICNTRVLPGGNRRDIEAHVRPLVELGRDGGLVLGQASVGPDIDPADYDFYQSLVQKLGGYT